jgi:hypothetical protein
MGPNLGPFVAGNSGMRGGHEVTAAVACAELLGLNVLISAGRYHLLSFYLTNNASYVKPVTPRG